MKVNQSTSNPAQSGEVDGAKKAGKPGPSSKTQTKRTADVKNVQANDVKAEISAKGKEFAQAKAIASSTPDIREEKIAELKRRIAEGKYKVDSQSVANNLVDEHLAASGMS